MVMEIISLKNVAPGELKKRAQCKNGIFPTSLVILLTGKLTQQ
tara:strand:- start:319 stop:447 length:129 start_codon:yes stop_codon:yes gene_type:complete